MITKKQYQDALKIVKEYREQVAGELLKIDKVLSEDDTLPISRYNLSARTKNALIYHYGDITLKEISDKMTRRKIALIRNFGDKSARELELLMQEHGLQLKE